ncbi:MAG: hypothetical protein B7Y36_18815, partial [Novosphingobium sp. 28-62-57]|uniref:hypothetical protein n=1 Tax=Novosphingobium sp. 28-62-57 TaxID=1970409 RepID=UPI000BD1D67C
MKTRMPFGMIEATGLPVAGKVKAARRESRKRVRKVNLRAAFNPRRAMEGLDLPLPEGAVRLVLPWPPSQLNPNARVGHPARKAKYARDYRQVCWSETLATFGCDGGRRLFPGTGRLAIRLDLFPPDRRVRDDDNAESAFKAGRDGVADALKVDDARFQMNRFLHIDSPRACVVLTFLCASTCTSTPSN